MRSYKVLALVCALSACGTPSSHDAGDAAGASDAGADVPRDQQQGLDVGSAGDAGVPADVQMVDVQAGDVQAGDVQAGDAGSAPARWVMGYYPGYQRGLYPVDEVDFSSMTHIAIGRVIPNADGSLATHFDIDNTNGPAMARALVARAHQFNRKAILMLGGAGEHAGFVGAASAQRRSVFVQNLVQLLADYNADGIDVDWEPVEAADEVQLRAVVHDLRRLRPNAILTMPVMWVNANFPQVPAVYGQLAADLDQVNVMSYGMAGAWDGWQSWHSSALAGHGANTPSSVTSSVDAFLAAGVPAAKLGVGIGFYGTCWSSPVTMPRTALGASTILADDNVMSFAHIMQSYYSTGAYHWDAVAHAPYLSFASPRAPENCTYVSYEDEQSIADKGAFVRTRNLGGAIIWTINEGYIAQRPAGSRNPLLSAARAAFLTP